MQTEANGSNGAIEEVSKEVASEYGIPPRDGFGGQSIDTNVTQ